MVAITSYQAPVTQDAPLLPQTFNWASVSLQSIFENGLRLEASVYATEAQEAKQLIVQCKYGAVPLNELVESCFYPGRFKRAYVSQKYGEKFFLPSQLNELAPVATKFIATKTIKELEKLRIKDNTLLITRSGTIGNCTIASNALINGIFSDDVIRLIPKQDHHLGFIYIYLRSSSGRTVLQSSNYGAVIQHIEPSHLLRLPIPNAPEILKTHIHRIVKESFRLRDESNTLIEQARTKLQKALELPSLEDLAPQPNGGNGLCAFSVNVASLNQRLEANYHNPLVQAIEKHCRQHAEQVLPLRDITLTHKFVLPGRFKRVYVEKDHGITFFSGKNIGELDPSDKRYLSFSQHDKKIKDELTIEKNMLLITCSGTVGNVTLVPEHWDGWTMTHDIIRLIPSSVEIGGYLFAWLSSSWGNKLINRYCYGAVVPHIEIEHLSQVSVPILSDSKLMQEISTMVLSANEKRYQAFLKEQEALQILNRDVLGLKN